MIVTEILWIYIVFQIILTEIVCIYIAFGHNSNRNREFTLFDYHIIPIITDNNKQYMQNNPTSMTSHIIHIYTHNYYLFKA